jgi:hypothetical protein
MKKVCLFVMRSALVAVIFLVLPPVFAIASGQTAQPKPLPTEPLEQYDDPPAPSAFRVGPLAPTPTPTPALPSPTPTPTVSATPGGTPTPSGTPTPTCCMLNGTVGTSCQYYSTSGLFDININALINNSCGQTQTQPANFYLEGSINGSTFEFIVRTSIQNYTFQPGQNSINESFLNQTIPMQYQYYRVRMQFYNCGIYFIYSPAAPVCRPGSTATPTGTPTGTPIPSPTATATPTPSPTPSATPLVSISGTVLYCSNPVPGPVPNVTLTLTGTMSGSTLSDGSGNYTFSSLAAGGNYTVTPTKAALAPASAGINTVDVIAIQRHFLVLGTPLSGCRLTAADVDLNSSVNTVDVVAVQRFFLGLSTGIANTGKYKFTPASRSYPGLVSDQTAQNYDALIYGDVATPFAERLDGPSRLSSHLQRKVGKGLTSYGLR